MRLQLFTCLAACLLATSVMPTSVPRALMVIGQRLPGDELIESREDGRRGSPDQPFSLSKTYAGNNVHLITQLVVEDLARLDGYAAVVAGGPGHTFVSLAYTIPRHSHMRYNVTIYGKHPGYRKSL